MLGAVLVVLVVGGGRAQATTTAFESAARAVLGGEAAIQIIRLDEAPTDEALLDRAKSADGIIELVANRDGTKTLLHCYLSREHRWVEREITFGTSDGNATRDALERGRLLGYAVATMFADESQLQSPLPPAVPPPNARLAQPSQPSAATTPTTAAVPVPTAEASIEQVSPSLKRRSLEFSGIASSGLGGTASGVGAIAGLRAPVSGPLRLRLFVAGRAGSVAAAQATTRDAQLGGGLAIAMPLREGRFELGLRSDLFLCYFDATHLSEDDVRPDRRSRWLPGADWVAEAGFRFSQNAGVFVGIGLEATLGKTDLYTHGRRVAVVPVLRDVGEIGFRIGF